MSAQSTVILWFRQDLRLADNPALQAAVESRLPVIPTYVWSPEEAGEWAMGSAARVWLHGSLNALQTNLRERDSDLYIAQGHTATTLLQLAQSMGAQTIHCNARYEPWARQQQDTIQQELARHDIQLVIHTGATLLWEPKSFATQQGKPYQLFTPYFNRCVGQLPDTTPRPAPAKLPSPDFWPQSLPVDLLHLLPTTHWDAGIRAVWQPGEQAAQTRLQDFLANALIQYGQARNLPHQQGTSCFSSYLTHGEISPRQIWHAVEEWADATPGNTATRKTASDFLRELVWREFAYHVLYHFPHTTTQPLKEKFRQMPWQENPEWLKRWQTGQTGYPLVDAGMRQLWRTGWMHNRVRMVVGSFLTKDLLIPWQDGARWFWDTLVDADLANNSLNWQWVAGCGADAQPFFRIFNPVSQSEKFDPDCLYIRQWVPELAHLSAKQCHTPWQTADRKAQQGSLLTSASQPYPAPMVDHGEARDKALHIYKSINPILTT